jgi:hypothetical protein
VGFLFEYFSFLEGKEMATCQPKRAKKSKNIFDGLPPELKTTLMRLLNAVRNTAEREEENYVHQKNADEIRFRQERLDHERDHQKFLAKLEKTFAVGEAFINSQKQDKVFAVEAAKAWAEAVDLKREALSRERDDDAKSLHVLSEKLRVLAGLEGLQSLAGHHYY